jgi:prephenate dehydratase
MHSRIDPSAVVGFLGPAGTFTEEAARSEPDLATADLRPLPGFVDVLSAVSDGRVDYGFVAVENSIEGTVNVTLDQLVFERDLLIVREVVLPVTQHLIGVPGTELPAIRQVVSFPHATGQCRAWLAKHLPGVEEVASSSTGAAVRHVGELRDPSVAAIGTPLAASIYDLEVLAPEIEDHPDNATRFLLVAPPSRGVPAPTGHDKTSIVCFQSADRPGSLHGILGQFSARDINLTKLESRPTKRSLGDYCFVIDLVGHIDDEIVADCLRDLHATLPRVKFLGSYPAAGDLHGEIRREARAAWEAADRWIGGLRSRIER